MNDAIRNPRFPYMDSLRAIAALSVFGAHAALLLYGIGGVRLSPYLARLDVGVSIFLMLSAFLLYRPFVAARYEGLPMPRLGPFAVRRAFRILPAYWVALTLVALARGLEAVFTAEGVVTYYGLLQVYDEDTITGGVGQAWTVCVEATFYALLPAWAFAARRLPAGGGRGTLRGELALLGALFAGGVVWKLVVFEQTSAGTTKFTPGIYSLPAFLDFFALGMALAVLSVHLAGRGTLPGWLRLADRRPELFWLGALVAFVASGFVADAYGEVDAARFTGRHLLNAVTAFLMLVPLVFGDQDRGWLRRVLANRALLWLGATSYAFYLYHLPILLVMREAEVHEAIRGPGFLALGFVLSLAAGGLSWYALERHALRLARRLAGGQASAGSLLERRDVEQEGEERPAAAAR